MSKTEKNLMRRFSLENSQARSASNARFRQDRLTRKACLRLPSCSAPPPKLKPSMPMPASAMPEEIGDTTANLKAAIEGEAFHEFTKMYPEMIADAKEEGQDRIAKYFDMVNKVEEVHANLYKKALAESLPPSPATSMSVPCAATRRKAPATSAPSVAPWLPLSPRSTSFLRVR